MKRIISFVLTLVLIFGMPVYSASAAEPLVPRKFALDMKASLGTYNNTEYIVLDIGVVDITEPYGIVSIEFDIEFDGSKLQPLWQTNVELNGDGTAVADGVYKPQMLISWPEMEKTTYIPGHGLQTYPVTAAMGLCKEYSVTGSGKLNVNFLMLDDCDAVVKEDYGIAIRLYFTPVDGFDNGATYTFTVDGKYDVPLSNQGDIGVAATSGLLNESGFTDRLNELRVYGYGAQASVTVRSPQEDLPDPDEPSTAPDESNDGGNDYETSDEADISEESSEEEISIPSLHRPSVDGVGDVNGDGITDNLDAAHILRYDANFISFDEEQLQHGDVNGDDLVNSLDASLVLKYDAGLINSFK